MNCFILTVKREKLDELTIVRNLVYVFLAVSNLKKSIYIPDDNNSLNHEIKFTPTD